MLLDLRQRVSIDFGSFGKAVPHLQAAHPPGKFFRELLVDTGLDVDEVGAHGCLPGIAKFCDNHTFDGGVDIWHCPAR